MVKETKLYDLLGVSPLASEAEIKKGYRKAALKCHPDKPTGDTEKFKEVSEACDILSNEEKREVYDQYGLEAARGNAPAGGNPFGGAGAGAGGGSPFGGMGGMGGGHGGSAHFSQADAFNIFSQMGGFGMGGGGSSFGGGGMPSGFGGGGMPGGFGGASGYGGGAPRRRPAPDTVTISLPVSLEDLYNGATKKMKINRKGPDGLPESKVLEVKLTPGWKAGTKVNFTNEGDWQPECQASQTICFVIEEKPNPVFKREGNDLHMVVPLLFKEALCGFDREITTIDGRKINLLRLTPVQPSLTALYPGLGMPISKSPGSRGNLQISYKIDFPISLTPQQKEAILNNF